MSINLQIPALLAYALQPGLCFKSSTSSQNNPQAGDQMTKPKSLCETIHIQTTT